MPSALFYDAEHVAPTASPKVMRAIAPPPLPGIREDAGRLLALASGDDEGALREALFGYVRVHDEPLPIHESAAAPPSFEFVGIGAARRAPAGAQAGALTRAGAPQLGTHRMLQLSCAGPLHPILGATDR